MERVIRIGERRVGDGQPVYVAAEVGINHNGDVSLAKKLIDVAVRCGSDAVKFQKRNPEKCVPPEQRDQKRQTPWGYITYLEYRQRMEFGEAEYRQIDEHCRRQGMPWFVSVWDEDSVDFMERFQTSCYKVPSAALTDAALLRRVRATGRPVILSTGMSTAVEIRKAVGVLGPENLLITHCTSTYPCQPGELNLRMIETLRDEFPCPVGYSGHEVGLPPTIAAVALGACYVERHITLDRAMWGSDQAASVEPQGLERVVKYIRAVEAAMGDGHKRLYDSELPVKKRLRRFESIA